MSVDKNHDGIDDNTGAVIGPGDNAGTVTAGADSTGLSAYMPQPAATAPGSSSSVAFNPQTAYTNYLNQYYTTNVWQGQPVLMGYHGQASHVEGGVTAASAASGNVPAPMHGGGGTVVHDNAMWATPYQVLADFDHWSHKQYEDFRTKLIAAGLVSNSATPDEVKKAYAKILEGVVQAQANHNMATPLDVINNYIRLNGLDPNKLGSGSGGSGPSTSTYTSKSVYDLTPENARATLRTALQQELGRDPTNAEMRDFIDAAQTRASNNPNVSVTTTHTDGAGNTTSNTQTTQSGFTDQMLTDMADRRGKQAPDYAKYQSAATYYPALVSALGATVS